jgi:hypothetical protein
MGRGIMTPAEKYAAASYFGKNARTYYAECEGDLDDATSDDKVADWVGECLDECGITIDRDIHTDDEKWLVAKAREMVEKHCG